MPFLSSSGVHRLCLFFPQTKHVSLLFFFFFFLFFVHHRAASAESPQNQNLHFTSNQTTSFSGFKRLWLAPSLSRSAFESAEKFTTLHFLLKQRENGANR